MAGVGDWYLDQKRIALLATRISKPNVQNIAMAFLDVTPAMLGSLEAAHRENAHGFNRDVLLNWAYKNRGPDQTLRLAAILYKAAELFSWVDPKVVQDILGVTVEEARAFAEQWDKSAGIAAGSALPSIEPPSMMALPGPRTLFAGSDPTQPQIAPVEPVGGRGPSNPGPDGQLSLVEAAETDAHRPVAPPADAVVTPDAEEGSAAVRRAEASYRGPTPPDRALTDIKLADLALHFTSDMDVYVLSAHLGVASNVASAALNDSKRVHEAALTVLRHWRGKIAKDTDAFRLMYMALSEMRMMRVIAEVLDK